MIRVGVLGAGMMGSTHLLAVQKLAEWKQMEIAVTAIADRLKDRRENAAKIWPEAAIYEEADEFLEKEELDAIHICLPSYLHAEYAIKAMEKGIPVLLEKPACLTEEDCNHLLETQKRTGVKAMVGQVLRFFPEYRLLKDLYEKKTYGELKSLVLQRLSQNVLWGYRNWFHDEKKSGSAVLDLHVHDTDFIRYLLGEPEGIQVAATAYEDRMINQILTHYNYPGKLVSAEGVWDINSKMPFRASYRAYFEDATVIFKGWEDPSVRIWKKDDTVEEPQLEKVPEPGAYYTETEYFYDCLEKGVEPSAASLEEGIRTVRLALKELEEAHRFLN